MKLNKAVLLKNLVCWKSPPKKDFLFWDLDFVFERLIKRSLSKSSVSRKTRELVSIEVQQIEQSWGFTFPKKSCRWRVKHHSFCAQKKGYNLEDITSVLKEIAFCLKVTLYLNNLDSIIITTHVSITLIWDIKCEIVATHVPPSISTKHLSNMAIQLVELPSGHPLLLHQSVPGRKNKLCEFGSKFPCLNRISFIFCRYLKLESSGVNKSI